MERGLNNHKIEIVRNLILKTFRFLEDQYFYTPVYKKEDDNIFMESLEIEYINEIKQRKVAISYTKGNLHKEIRYTFTLSITRIPYKNPEDFFSLDNYLKSKGRFFSTSIVNDFNETEIENILNRIAVSLKEQLLSIITGNEWLTSYYPRKD